MIKELRRETEKLRNKEKAKACEWFFKTGKGEYGEGDEFYGITVPNSRKIAKKYKDLPFSEIRQLLKSKIHEERFIALLILILQYQKENQELKQKIFDFYLNNTRYINNWDLVDLSAHKIIGNFLQGETLKAERNCKGLTLLKQFAKSKNQWERRIAIISTFAFIDYGSSKETLEIAEILVNDKHDLIHKAVGWALREVGKRVSLIDEKKFLNKYGSYMPRTMLRYAIERFPKKLRLKYLNYGKETKQRATSGG